MILLAVHLGGCVSSTRQITPGQQAPLPSASSRPTVTATVPEPETPLPTAVSSPAANAPEIYDVSTNTGEYADGKIPLFSKFELTFQVNTVAENLQMPFDANPPPGVVPGMGISVDALFSSDGWQTVYTQPAFYYQEFDDQVKSGSEWFYPTGRTFWKIRFAPDQVGDWQYKLAAQDSGGRTETAPAAFTVVASGSHGFVRVSQADPRYFEFDDGTYFPALGYNMNYNGVSWTNPVLDNQENFKAMSENGIQLVRIWLSQWGIYTSAWNPWNSIDPSQHSLYVPETGIYMSQAHPGSEISMRINAEYNPCMFIGAFKAPPAVKRNTDYRIRILYKAEDIRGPVVGGQPYGFVGKTGGWLWGDEDQCNLSGAGQVVTAYQAESTADWQILEGRLNSGETDFLPLFYLVMENVSAGSAYVDSVWIEEDLGGGQYGPNIVSKPWMAQHLTMEQRNSYAFDKVLDLAEQYGVYLRPVILEKNEPILQSINFDGLPIPYSPLCYDDLSTNDPPECPGNQWFYGNGRSVTKVRWLQQAWWRYLQARWGYSTSIHSWELLNEGDPADENHYALADEFGRYMRQFRPNHHLVSTSFWHSFPRDEFWANGDYPNIDFADLHEYIPQDAVGFADTALATYDLSMRVGARQPGGAGKPVIRGETGFVTGDTWPPSPLIIRDQHAVWLHNFIWGGINPGGLIESYWYDTDHIYQRGHDGSTFFDHRWQYRTFYNFIRSIPLNNGYYQDAQAQVSDARLRAWGQKDLQNQQAHLWIQNLGHTWQNAMNDLRPVPVSATVEVAGFQPGVAYRVEWWDSYQPDPARQVLRSETVYAAADGALILEVVQLSSDIAVKICPDR